MSMQFAKRNKPSVRRKNAIVSARFMRDRPSELRDEQQGGALGVPNQAAPPYKPDHYRY
jgi:hypothetical protein